MDVPGVGVIHGAGVEIIVAEFESGIDSGEGEVGRPDFEAGRLILESAKLVAVI